jgi:hypothetical protein
MIEKMLVCLLVAQSVAGNDRTCEWRCQNDTIEVVTTDKQFQCPRRLYIDDPERKKND